MKVGDIVVLKSEYLMEKSYGPARLMTVESVDGTTVKTVWFTYNGHHYVRDQFQAGTLQIVLPEDKILSKKG